MTPSITNTFVNATTIRSGDHNVNYADGISHISDGDHDLTISDILINGVLTISGNIVLGNSSSSSVNINGLLGSSLLANSGKEIGGSSNPFRSIYLSSSGAVYFDAGTTYKLQSSSTELDYVPATDISIPFGIKNTTISVPTFDVDELTIGNRLYGNRYVITVRGYLNSSSKSNEVLGTISGGTSYSTANHGIVMPGSGSVIGYSVNAYMNVSSSSTLAVKLLKNGSAFLTLGSFSSGSSPVYKTNRSTAARNTNTFSSDDVLTVVVDKSSGTTNYSYVYVALEFILD